MERLRKSIKLYDNGASGFDLRFAVIGKHGAVEFHGHLWPNEYIQKNKASYLVGEINTENYSFKSYGFEYHGRKPLYNKHELSQDFCELLQGPCYHDGTSLQASEFAREFSHLEKRFIMAELEYRYKREWEAK